MNRNIDLLSKLLFLLGMFLMIGGLMGCLLGCPGDKQSAFEARAKLKEVGVEYNEQAFIDAVLEGDVLIVKLFLNAGMDPNTEADAAPWMVKKGKLVANFGDLPMPVLLAAWMMKHQEILELLKESGAAVEQSELARAKIRRLVKERADKFPVPPDPKMEKLEGQVKDLQQRMIDENKRIEDAIQKKSQALKTL